MTAEETLARLDEFQKPTKDATLGVRKDAVWLHIPLTVDPASDGRWVLEINHPDLNRIDVLLLQGAKVLQRSVLGTEVPRAQRPLPGRTPAQAFQLEAGQNYEFLLRVQTRGAMILPITFNTPTGILGRAVNEQMLQGVLTGLALCLIFYSMAQWYSLREPMFIQYALLTSGSLLYSLHFFGVGQQYLWGHSPWLTSHAVVLASLMAITGSFLFMSQALEGHNPQSRFLRRMRLGALQWGAARQFLDSVFIPDLCHPRHAAVHARAGLAHQRAAHQGATRQPAARRHALAGPHRPVDRPAQPLRHADRTIVSPRARHT